MASFNKVILLGTLTRDPQVRYIPSGTAVAELGMALNHSYFDKATNSKKESVTFCDVTLWGRTAEIAGEYLQKGRQCLIEGRLHLDTWQDKESGQNRSKLKVVGESMTMVGGKGGERRESSGDQGAPDTEQASEWIDGHQPNGAIPEDEVPF